MEVDVKAPHSEDSSIDVVFEDLVGEDIALQLALFQQQQTEQQRQALQCMLQLQRQFLPVPSNVALPLPLGLAPTFVPPQPSSTPLPSSLPALHSLAAAPLPLPTISSQPSVPVAAQPLASSDEANNEEMRHWAIGSNLHRFIAAATPALTLTSPHFTLADVWSYYDQPYGHEVPLIIDGRECYAFFVPYLSAIQLFAPPTPSPFGPQPSTRPLFEYFEFLTPDQRMPLLDKVKQLGESFPILVNGKTSEIDTSRSWYSISWSPILCDHYTNKALSGCFLTYHRFEAVGDCPVTHLVCEEAEREQEQHDDHHHDDCDMDLGMEEIDCFCPSAPSETYLNFVGCVAYKVRPETWFDRKSDVPTLSALSLQSNVLRLLAEARVSNHPDLLHMTRRGAR